ncbi:MAG: LacI family DNA-binding transcriptional regulator [Galactobacter sp.]
MTTTPKNPSEPVRKPPGIKDVALRAGVSWKTVSNVVNGTGRVSDATRARVEEAISELGYRPSLAGRQLRRGRTGILALAVPWVDSPYFAALAHEVITAAAARGHRVFIDETRAQRQAEEIVARGYEVRLIDGIIFSPLALTLAEADRTRGSLPMVLLGERPSAGVEIGTDHVSIDNVQAARQTTEHVIATGRTRIGFLGAEPEQAERSGAPRLKGYLQALEAAGVSTPNGWVVPAKDYSRGTGAAATEEMLPRIGDIDALVCANDELAIGAMHTLRRNGVRVPTEVAVTGWDNSEESRFSNPTLTTVAPDLRGIAEHAVARVIAQIEGGPTSAQDLVLPHRLLIRESSSPPQ